MILILRITGVDQMGIEMILEIPWETVINLEISH